MTHLTRPNCPGSPWITIKGLQWASLRTLHSTEVGGETVLWVQELFKAQKGKWVGISYLQIKYHRNTHTSASKDMYENVPSTTRVMVNEQNLIGCPWTVKEVRKWKCGPTEILYSNEKSTQQQWGRTSPIRKWVKKAREKKKYMLYDSIYIKTKGRQSRGAGSEASGWEDHSCSLSPSLCGRSKCVCQLGIFLVYIISM